MVFYLKKVDIGFGCLALFKDKKESSLVSEQIALGMLAFLTNKKNKVDSITLKDAKDILKGKIKNWKELGGDNTPIHLILRKSPKSGVGSTLKELLFKDKNYPLNSAFKYVKNSTEVRETVANDKYAIGVDDVTSSNKVSSVKLINIDDVKPTKEAIIDGYYKYRRPFFACMNQEHKQLAKLFLNYAMSKSGQKIISMSGTANLAEGKSIDSQNNFIIQQLKFRMNARKNKKSQEN